MFAPFFSVMTIAFIASLVPQGIILSHYPDGVIGMKLEVRSVNPIAILRLQTAPRKLAQRPFEIRFKYGALQNQSDAFLSARRAHIPHIPEQI